MKTIYSYSALIFAIICLSVIKVNAQVARVTEQIAKQSSAKFKSDVRDSEFKTGLIAGGFVTYSLINTFGASLLDKKVLEDDNENPAIKRKLNNKGVLPLNHFTCNSATTKREREHY